mmetsp:Transcript_46358/g.129241  ORF Transcript_46358/g.129241 Transcript_46358/m.129241 type:complete len:208 (-) Transcript_46358:41-664(-)
MRSSPGGVARRPSPRCPAASRIRAAGCERTPPGAWRSCPTQAARSPSAPRPGCSAARARRLARPPSRPWCVCAARARTSCSTPSATASGARRCRSARRRCGRCRASRRGHAWAPCGASRRCWSTSTAPCGVSRWRRWRWWRSGATAWLASSPPRGRGIRSRACARPRWRPSGASAPPARGPPWTRCARCCRTPARRCATLPRSSSSC